MRRHRAGFALVVPLGFVFALATASTLDAGCVSDVTDTSSTGPDATAPADAAGDDVRAVEDGGGDATADGPCVAQGDACAASSCGTLLDSCGNSVTCGSCADGSSCAGTPPAGPYSCQVGACDAGQAFCTSRCGKITDGCGVLEDCKTCNGSFCVSTNCTCPAPDLAVTQYHNASQVVCYGTHASDCPNYGLSDGVVARIYSTQVPGTVPLYTCRTMDSDGKGTLVTLTSNCDGVLDPGLSLRIGYALPVGDGTCSAVPLYEFYSQATSANWLVSTSSTTPPNYNSGGERARVWPP